MSDIEKLYFHWLNSTTEECRKYDENFQEVEQEYCAYLLDKEYEELKAIFGDTED